MNTHKFMVEEIRFHLNIPDTLIFVGWFYDGTTKNHTLTVQLDNNELPVVKLVNKGVEVCQKYIRCVNEISEEVVGVVKLPKHWREGHRLSIQSTYKGKPHRDAVYSVGMLQRLENKITYCIENVKRTEDKVIVNGWCMGNGEIKLSLLDYKKQPLTVKTDHFYKKDLEQVGPEDEKREKLFFSAQTDCVKEKELYLEIRSAKSFELVRLDKWNNDAGAAGLWFKSKKALRYFKRNGMKATLVKINSKLGHDTTSIYKHWREKYGVTVKELEEQRSFQAQFKLRPKFSIAVPLYRTDEIFLRELLASVQNQTYDNWELCLADGSEDSGKGLSAIVSQYQQQDSRIRYRILEKNYGIAQNMNQAMQMAEGDFVLLVDHDDTLTPDALFEFAKAINEEPSTEVLYSDEDKVDATGKKYFEPHFKPDFDLDFLLSNNYICHLFAVKRELLNRVGGFLSEYDGSQDYDFILRCCEEAKGIYHVPKILYHWRCHFDSTSANPQSKLYAFEAGRRAVEAHYKRLNIPAEVEHAQFNGLYRTHYRWSEKPLVSVIIPNNDHVEALSRCIQSILWSNYCHYEIIVVENNSVNQETFAYYEKLKKEYDNIQVVTYEGEFHLSKIYNFGEKTASGDYLLLLNHDTQMMDGNCIGEMLGHCMRSDVGVVGAKILSADDTIYHAGIVLGFGGTAGYVFRGKSRYTVGYESRILCAQDYSAVTSVCMMVKRNVYKRVGGMPEDLSATYGDLDFCLKVRNLGLLVVYNPYAELFYYGPKSKGVDNKETEILLDRWGKVIEAGDPYYNPNLTLEKLDFSLRR